MFNSQSSIEPTLTGNQAFRRRLPLCYSLTIFWWLNYTSINSRLISTNWMALKSQHVLTLMLHIKLFDIKGDITSSL